MPMTNGSRIYTEMLGKTFKTVVKMDHEELIFLTNSGEKFRFYHAGDCCESVLIEDVVGDLVDLLDTPLLIAQEVWQSGDHEEYGHETWTFYTFATIKGTVTVRWRGISNGYYSESVDFYHESSNGEQLS